MYKIISHYLLELNNGGYSDKKTGEINISRRIRIRLRNKVAFS